MQNGGLGIEPHNRIVKLLSKLREIEAHQTKPNGILSSKLPKLVEEIKILSEEFTANSQKKKLIDYFIEKLLESLNFKSRTVFRGDSREPSVIFSEGLQPRDASQPHHRERGGTPNPASRICFSHRFATAAVFPLDVYQEETWVYLLQIPITNDYELYSTTLVTSSPQKFDMGRHMLLFGDEGNVSQIPPEQIIGAVKCIRKFQGRHVFDGGVYRVTGKLILNEKFVDLSRDKGKARLLKTFIEEEVKRIWSLLSIPTNGFKFQMSHVAEVSVDIQATMVAQFIMKTKYAALKRQYQIKDNPHVDYALSDQADAKNDDADADAGAKDPRTDATNGDAKAAHHAISTSARDDEVKRGNGDNIDSAREMRVHSTAAGDTMRNEQNSGTSSNEKTDSFFPEYKWKIATVAGLLLMGLSVLGGPAVAGVVFGTIVKGMLATASAYSAVGIGGAIGLTLFGVGAYKHRQSSTSSGVTADALRHLDSNDSLHVDKPFVSSLTNT